MRRICVLWIRICHRIRTKLTGERPITMRLHAEWYSSTIQTLNLAWLADRSMTTSTVFTFLLIFLRFQFVELISLFRFSHVFWIGDLNYRLYDNPPREFFDTYNYADILQQDQLKREMMYNRVFVNYNEGPINFRPTYKYDPGTDNFDSRY